MNMQIGVKVIIQNTKGEILLLKRKHQFLIPSKVDDAWDIPGGRIEPSESLRDALVREVREEIGVDLQGTPNLLAAQDIFVTTKNIHVVRLTYLHVMDIPSVTLSDEHTGYEWLPIPEAKNFETEPYLKEVLRTLVYNKSI